MGERRKGGGYGDGRIGKEKGEGKMKNGGKEGGEMKNGGRREDRRKGGYGEER